MKKCTKCQREQLLDQFRPDSRYKGGLKNWCRGCESAYSKQLYQKNIKRHREASRASYQRRHSIKELPKPGLEDIIYTAGLLDGESTITANNRLGTPTGRQAVHFRILLSNTFLPITEWLQKTWGGKVYNVKQVKAIYKPIRVWYVSAKEAANVLSQVLPYLKIKNRQAELVLELSKLIYVYKNAGDVPGHKFGRYVPPEFIPRRQEIIAELQKLNHRGVPQELPT